MPMLQGKQGMMLQSTPVPKDGRTTKKGVKAYIIWLQSTPVPKDGRTAGWRSGHADDAVAIHSRPERRENLARARFHNVAGVAIHSRPERRENHGSTR